MAPPHRRSRGTPAFAPATTLYPSSGLPRAPTTTNTRPPLGPTTALLRPTARPSAPSPSGPAPGGLPDNTGAPPPPRHGRAPRAPRSPDYYVNVGAAIDALRADYPCILSRTPELGVYAENVVFRDRKTGYALAGKSAYARLFWALRMQAALCFSSASVCIHSLYHDDDAGVVYLRWRLQATPRVWGLIHPPPLIVLDGMSVYSLNVHGFLCEHVLDNSAPTRSRKLRPFIEDVLSLGQIRVATPEPVTSKPWHSRQQNEVEDKLKNNE